MDKIKIIKDEKHWCASYKNFADFGDTIEDALSNLILSIGMVLEDDDIKSKKRERDSEMLLKHTSGINPYGDSCNEGKRIKNKQINFKEVYDLGYEQAKKDIKELIDEVFISSNRRKIDFKDELIARIKGNCAEQDLEPKNDNLQGKSTAQKGCGEWIEETDEQCGYGTWLCRKCNELNKIKIARRCMNFKNIKCKNKYCLNESCPLHKIYDRNQNLDALTQNLPISNEKVGCGKVISEGDNVICGKDNKFCMKCNSLAKEEKE